jgi:hypothetical protein
LRAKRGHATSVGGLAVTPEGQLFSVVNRTADVDNGGIQLNQSQLELNMPGKPPTRVKGKPGQTPRQAVYGDADADHLVWMETTSTDLTHQPWVLILNDRRTGSSRVLDSSPRDVPAPPTGTIPSLAGGRVFWAAAVPTGSKQRPARAHIYSRAITGSAPSRVEVKDAMMPNADGRFLYYAKSAFLDPTLPEGTASIHRLDLLSRKDSVVQELHLTADQRLAGLTSSGNDVAWIVNTSPGAAGPENRAAIYISEDGQPPISVGGTGVAFDTPVMTNRLVGWTDVIGDGGEWIFDRNAREVSLLARSPGLASVLASGPHVGWRDGNQWRSATLPAG